MKRPHAFNLPSTTVKTWPEMVVIRLYQSKHSLKILEISY